MGPAPEGGDKGGQVNPLGTLRLPRQGCRPGVAELAAVAGDTLDELDCLPARDVDGGQELKAQG